MKNEYEIKALQTTSTTAKDAGKKKLHIPGEIMIKNMHNSKKIALSGIITALGAVSLFLENIVPTGKIGFYVFAGFLLSIVIIECGLIYGWISFSAVSMLAVLIVPDKIAVTPYVLFFGIYSLIKSHIEKIDKNSVQWILKFLYFNLSLYILYMISDVVFPELLSRFFDVLPFYVIIIVMQIAFFLYDWIFSLWIQYYLEKIKPKLRNPS